MILAEKIALLRRQNGWSQEELAEKLGISRQTLSKYETGESVPDIERSKAIADAFGVSLDELVNYESGPDSLPVPPKGRHAFGVVKVGEKGQIVIPAKARKVFDIQAGDNLIVLGDEAQGIALLKEKDFMAMVEEIRNQK